MRRRTEKADGDFRRYLEHDPEMYEVLKDKVGEVQPRLVTMRTKPGCPALLLPGRGNVPCQSLAAADRPWEDLRGGREAEPSKVTR
jgi:hypothetical protein